MSARQQHGTRKGERRRWRVPPPLVHDGDAPGPEGIEVLGEFRNELGGVLWRTLRSTLQWAAAGPADRRDLFTDGMADERHAEILRVLPSPETPPRKPLEDLLAVLARPDRVDPAFVGLALQRVATWAEGEGAPRTRLEFLQAAALTCPADPWFALGVANASRDLARYGRAEAWYFRAVGLARTRREWHAYVRAYLNHGIMMLRRGALPAARRSMLKALRRSRRQGNREGEAKTLHDLSALEFRAGDFARAIDYSGAALEAYGAGHEALPRLAHDIAYYWLELGDHARALAVFHEAIAHVGPAERPVVLGSIARAAAGAGDLGAYRWARRELGAYAPAPGIAEAWVDVARASMALGRADEAREAARLAEDVARARREGQLRFMAEEILATITDEAAQREDPARDHAPAASRPSDDALVRQLLRTLRSHPAGGRSRGAVRSVPATVGAGETTEG